MERITVHPHSIPKTRLEAFKFARQIVRTPDFDSFVSGASWAITLACNASTREGLETLYREITIGLSSEEVEVRNGN